jgi:hypothetical protein
MFAVELRSAFEWSGRRIAVDCADGVSCTELGDHSRQIAGLRVAEVQPFMLGEAVDQRLWQ